MPKSFHKKSLVKKTSTNWSENPLARLFLSKMFNLAKRALLTKLFFFSQIKS